ncbi:PilZ domain-containing protein [Sphingomonas rosea]
MEQGRIQHHRPRAPRRKLYLPVRMRSGAAWADVCLLDLSTRGLQVKCPRTPPTGSYIEVRRGRHVIVARVVWTKKDRFGALTQDAVPVDAVAADRDETATAASDNAQAQERRLHPRPSSVAEAFEQSRFAGRAIEFGLVLAGIVGVAMFGASVVGDAIGTPIHAVTAALR